LLYEMATGQAPEIGVVPNPRQTRPDLPVEVEQVILKAMAKYPEQRFQSAGEFGSALTEALGIQETVPTPIAASAPETEPEAAVQETAVEESADNGVANWMKWLIGGLAVVLLAMLCCIGAYLVFGFGDSGEGGNGGGSIIIVVPTPAPAVPSVTAIRNTDIRTGPGSIYDKIGVLEQGQSAEAIGRSVDSQWWVIKVGAAANGQGWVAAQDVDAQNTENVPVIQAPPTPTPQTSEPGPPNAVIVGDTEGVVGQVVNFSGGESTPGEGSQIVSYAWDFDDGSESNGVDVSHAFNNSGNYQVELTVTDNNGLTDSTTHKINIEQAPDTPEPEQPPVAVINGPSKAEVGETVTFSAEQSKCAGQCVGYAWNMGDGSQYNAVVINHVYNTAGVFIVDLVVTDDKGLQGSANQRIEVEVVDPGPEDTPIPEPEPGED